MKYMEKLKGITFDWKISIDTLLVVGALLISTGMLMQRVSSLEKEQNRMQDRIALMDQRNTDEHKEIVKTLSSAAAMINYHVKTP